MRPKTRLNGVKFALRDWELTSPQLKGDRPEGDPQDAEISRHLGKRRGRISPAVKPGDFFCQYLPGLNSRKVGESAEN